MPDVAMLLFPGVQFMGLAAQTAFEIANLAVGSPYYTLHLVSLTGGNVPSSMGFDIGTGHVDALDALDTLILLGGVTIPQRLPTEQIATLQHHMRRARRVAGLCTGAFYLAQTGALDGRRATTHWLYASRMRADHPLVKVEEDRIFINEGPVWTSAGLTAGLDLALALVEKDLGLELSRTVARRLVMSHRRAGGQSQHSELLDLAPKSDRIQKALVFARCNLASPLTIEELAAVVNLSPRQFSRAFSAETGQSPAKVVERLRVEAARLLIDEGRLSFDEIAQETGLVDRRRLREAFIRQFGQTPQGFRRLSRVGSHGGEKEQGL
ncbi:GlxA family transcriptional regulator [Gluconacetobacter tumulicola]|uniref:GlxA family transcriptional regulator n=1 Tax=Gluconacetobacter tumulicola TaxID=1017177 RepID=A0A7W4P5R6_9PROT|nr:GlxA family transcriptional regulator [Gluconacetobacter tumulicola]MBB2178661.1 GlxA family transcriptional regulator [Gluconacetobacter tumulicola]